MKTEQKKIVPILVLGDGESWLLWEDVVADGPFHDHPLARGSFLRWISEDDYDALVGDELGDCGKDVCSCTPQKPDEYPSGSGPKMKGTSKDGKTILW